MTKRIVPVGRLWLWIPVSLAVLVLLQSLYPRPDWEAFDVVRTAHSQVNLGQRFHFWYTDDCSDSVAYTGDTFAAAVMQGNFRSYIDKKNPNECVLVHRVVAAVEDNLSMAAGPFKLLAGVLLDWVSIGNRGAAYISQARNTLIQFGGSSQQSRQVVMDKFNEYVDDPCAKYQMELENARNYRAKGWSTPLEPGVELRIETAERNLQGCRDALRTIETS